jgi:hypothetical protein
MLLLEERELELGKRELFICLVGELELGRDLSLGWAAC